jgi:hypothetical protein
MEYRHKRRKNHVQKIHQRNQKGAGIMTVHENTLQGLQEALDYVKGDKSKGRTFYTELPDAEIEQAQILWRKITSLSQANKRKAYGYIDGLLQTAAR